MVAGLVFVGEAHRGTTHRNSIGRKQLRVDQETAHGF